jgi:hypothetical protein
MMPESSRSAWNSLSYLRARPVVRGHLRVLRFLGLEHDKGSVEALMSSEGYSLYCREEESADGAIHDRLQLLDHGASLRPTVESRPGQLVRIES